MYNTDKLHKKFQPDGGKFIRFKVEGTKAYSRRIMRDEQKITKPLCWQQAVDEAFRSG